MRFQRGHRFQHDRLPGGLPSVYGMGWASLISRHLVSIAWPTIGARENASSADFIAFIVFMLFCGAMGASRFHVLVET